MKHGRKKTEKFELKFDHLVESSWKSVDEKFFPRRGKTLRNQKSNQPRNKTTPKIFNSKVFQSKNFKNNVLIFFGLANVKFRVKKFWVLKKFWAG